MRRLLLLMLPLLVIALIGFVGVSTDGASEDDAAPTGSGGPGNGTVAIEGFAFAPEDLTVAAGTEVTWTNGDGSPHSIQDDSGEELFEESEDLDDGDSFGFTYERPGEYAYLCGIHNYMQGTVTVTG